MYKIQMDVLLDFLKRKMVFIVVAALVAGVALTLVTTADKGEKPVFSSTSVIFVSDYRSESADKRFNYQVSEGSVYSACRSYIEEPSFALKVADELKVNPEDIKVLTPRIKDELNDSVSSPFILLQVSANDKDVALKGAQVATTFATQTFKDLMRLNQVEVLTQPVLDPADQPVASQSKLHPKKLIVWTGLLLVVLTALCFAQTIFSRKIRVASDVATKLGIEPSAFVRNRDLGESSPREKVLAAQISTLIAGDKAQRPGVVTFTTADMETSQFASLVSEVTEKLDDTQKRSLVTLCGADQKLKALEELASCDALYVVLVARKARSGQVVAAHECLTVLNKPIRILFSE